ncbi:MAG: hypothetical protein MI922_20955 [Bacteroidales bacterium]|nr:hypothetical protein [Bacteroidales bacterium]
MRIIYSLLISAFIASSALAQFKIVETSNKKKPEWIEGNATGFLVSMGNGDLLDKAGQQAFETLRQKIAEQAIQLMFNDVDYFKNLQLSKEKAKELFSKSTYYCGLSKDKISAYYWERHKDKKAKKEHYTYYIKYPFSKESVEKNINAFAVEHEINTALERFENDLGHCKTIDEYRKVWEGLMFLSPKVGDGDERREKLDGLMQGLEGKFNNMQVVEMLNIPGKLIVTQMLDDRAVIASRPPTVKMDCGLVMNVENFEDQWIIDYDYSDCSKAKEHKIHVEFDNSFNTITNEFAYDPKDIRAEVLLGRTDIVLKSGNYITFFVSSKYRGNVTLDKVVMRYNNLNFTETPLNQLLEGAGLYTIGFNPPRGFANIKIDERVRGELHFTIQESKQKKVYRFYNHPLIRK